MDFSSLPNRPNLRPKEVANFLAIGLATVYEMIQTEDLPSVRVGSKTLRIPRDDFVKMLRQKARGQLELF